jgi:hypothetical protein
LIERERASERIRVSWCVGRERREGEKGEQECVTVCVCVPGETAPARESSEDIYR